MKSLTGSDIVAKKKEEKEIFVIRRSIFIIFVFFAALIMIINLFLITFGLCYNRLLLIIEEGARPPELLNVAIMAEAGSTISLDAIAQTHNDLLIGRGFVELILKKRLGEIDDRVRQLESEISEAPSEGGKDTATE